MRVRVEQLRVLEEDLWLEGQGRFGAEWR